MTANPVAQPIPQELHARLARRGAGELRRGWPAPGEPEAGLAAAGVRVVPFAVDREGFDRYVRESGYPARGYWQGGRQRAAVEKYLEHFVSLDLLEIAPGDVVIDVASCTSPFPEIVADRYGCRVYRQDIVYPPGVEGDRIGGDACAMPVAEGFADKMVLHCSFEHFEGDRDGRFVREAARVLRPGGRLCILPLYFGREYAVMTDPDAWGEREPELDPEALTWLAEGYGELHGRLYDVPRFLDRVVAHLGDLELTVHRVDNAAEIDPGCYLRLAAVLVKPGGGGEAAASPAPPDPRNPDPGGHLERLHRRHAAERAAMAAELERERGGGDELKETYEAEIARQTELREAQARLFEEQAAAARRSLAEQVEAARRAFDADRETYERAIEHVNQTRQAELAALASRNEEVARLTAEADELDGARRELAAIHGSKMWRLWMAYHRLRGRLLRPFARR